LWGNVSHSRDLKIDQFVDLFKLHVEENLDISAVDSLLPSAAEQLKEQRPGIQSEFMRDGWPPRKGRENETLVEPGNDLSIRYQGSQGGVRIHVGKRTLNILTW
jgi:hypothetical protein